MERANISEFPFVQELPKSERAEVKGIWDDLMEFKRLSQEKGFLIPTGMAPGLAGVSRQRIYDLIEAGRLERVTVGNFSFVTDASLGEFVRSDRKPGPKPKHAE